MVRYNSDNVCHDFEKKGKKLEHFREILLDGHRVYFAKGKRSIGEGEWTIGDRDKQLYRNESEDNVRQYYDDTLAKIEAERFKPIGDDLPVIAPWRERHIEEANKFSKALRQFDEKHNITLALTKGNTITLVGHGANSGTFIEYTLHERTVSERGGKLGKKGRNSEEEHRSPDAALRSALISIQMSNRLGYQFKE